MLYWYDVLYCFYDTAIFVDTLESRASVRVRLRASVRVWKNVHQPTYIFDVGLPSSCPHECT